MLTPTHTRRLFWVAESLLLAGSVAAAALLSHAEEWRPLALVGLLLALALVGQRLILTIRGQHLTAGFIPFVLAMSLLGPAPAVAIGVAAMVAQLGLAAAAAAAVAEQPLRATPSSRSSAA